MSLAEKLKELPENSGVYVMRDASGEIIYIGKAVVLKNRVRQYFNNSPKPVKVQAMVDHIADFEYMITLTEKDALALEATLIRKYKPRYNILLKDDKSSPYIRIDLSEEYPALEVTRRLRRDGAKYFGPYFNGIRVTELVDILRSAYRIRTCSRRLAKRKRPCLNYDIGLCSAPCAERITPEEYRENVNKAMRFLSGSDDGVETLIESKMTAAAAREEFERAMVYRDRLEMLKRLRERTVANLGSVTDVDAFAYAGSGSYGVVSVCTVRGSKLVGVRNYFITDATMGAEELYSSFMTQYYGSNNEAPQEICTDERFDTTALSQYLSTLNGRTPVFTFPQKGTRARLVKTAQENASDYLIKAVDKQKREEAMTIGAVSELAHILGIKSAHRMECYDISHVQGVDKVASQAVFIGGKPSPSDYRKYKIKEVEGSDDFRCMEEVIKRRLERAREDEKFSYLPDLIVIDGGKGQLSFAHGVVRRLGYDIPMISLAKREEEIFTPYSPEPIVLKKDDFALRLLQRIRDEAHRFAITYHRGLRSKRYFSELDDIEGVGPKKRALLLKAFESFDDIRGASAETLAAVEGIDARTARNIYEYFHKEKRND